MKQAAASYKSAIYEQLARIGKAVASPRRLELLDLLAHGFRAVRLEDGVPDWRARGFDVVGTASAS